MKKIIFVLAFVFFKIAFAQPISSKTMEFAQLAIKSLSNQPAYRNAVASIVTYKDHDICTVIVMNVMANELKGVVFPEDKVELMGLLWATLDIFRNNESAKGVSRDKLYSTFEPYHQEALINQQAYFNKYLNYCVNVAGKVVTEARAGK